MSKIIAILATMDTKGAESHFIRQEIEALGGRTLLIDIGVVGKATIEVSTPVSMASCRARSGSMPLIFPSCSKASGG